MYVCMYELDKSSKVSNKGLSIKDRVVSDRKNVYLCVFRFAEKVCREV